MGGCATKPKVLKGDETEAPAPVLKEEEEEAREVAVVEEEAAKDEVVVVADNDTKRQSLGFLFENDGKLGSDHSDKKTNELVEQKSYETKKASDAPEAKPLDDVGVEEFHEPAADIPEPSDEKKEAVKPMADSLEAKPSQRKNAKIETLEEENPIISDQTNSLENETAQTIEEVKPVENAKIETVEEENPIISDQTNSLENGTSQTIEEAKPVEKAKIETLEEENPIISDQTNSLENGTSQTIEEVKPVENAKVEILKEENPVISDQTNSLEMIEEVRPVENAKIETVEEKKPITVKTDEKQVDEKAETAEEKKIGDKPNTPYQKTEK